jgi:beta-glucosidase
VDESDVSKTEDTPLRPAGYGGLWWGVSMSSLQCEGVAPAADWSRWEREGRVPRSSDGNGFATDYTADFEAFATLGFTHIRLTLEWARLEPEPGRIDRTAFDRYDDILSAARKAGLSVIATLAHGTLPGWFADDTQGFRDPAGRERDWARHVDRCAERYDSDVDVWVPVDDPVGWAVRGYLLGSRPPGLRDPETAMAAAEGALLASHEAWLLLASGRTPVMGVFGTPTIFGVGPESSTWQRWWHELIFMSWIRAIQEGELRLPGRTPLVIPEMAGSLDMIGLGHDHPIGIDGHGAVTAYPDQDRRSDTGFTPVPNELAELVAFVSSELPEHPIVVAGNGVPTSDDEWREEILKDIVDVVVGARQDGVNLAGYLHDTGIDGYEGPYGFATQRGLLTRSRDVKDSGAWLSAQLNGSAG